MKERMVQTCPKTLLICVCVCSYCANKIFIEVWRNPVLYLHNIVVMVWLK
jgi:hypothetical protein